ncbi:MAG TPA: carbohydrate kinase [Thermotoga sp.]|nr:carbohydrate kinase [Thermotoga sp.]
MITFIGHVSKDVNVKDGKENVVPGGGVFYGAFPAKAFVDKVKVITKGNMDDKPLFSLFEEKGIELIWLNSPSTTSIKNVYPTNNPDDRESRMISRALPFRKEDIENISSKIIHVSPLWKGEFPEELFEVIRGKCDILSTDAQGFLRNVDDAGNMYYKKWEKASDTLKIIDIFKMDINEAKILTGEENPEKALKIVSEMGPREVILTYRDGVFLYAFGNLYHEPFSGWTIEGRTGRGDTCIATYLALRTDKDPQEALKISAEITSRKMKKPGPYIPY